MGLKTRNAQVEAIAQEAARKAYRLVHKYMDADGTVQAEATGSEVMQQEDLERILPYGFFSTPPSDAGSVAIPCEGSDIQIGESIDMPSGVPKDGTSGTIYSSAGSYVQALNGGGVIAEPDGANFVKLGKNATEFVALANRALAELGKIVTWANTHTHGGATAAPVLGAASSVAATRTKAE